MNKKVVKDLEKLGITNIMEDEPLYKHTTYRVGGPADVYVEASDLKDIEVTVQYALENNIKYLVLGNGSNVLINDKQFEGIVIATKKLNSYEIDGTGIYAMCGVNLISLANTTAKHGLSGLEFASGIPGCVGGSVFMNAGAYKKSMSDVVDSVLVFKDGKQVWLSNKEMQFSYRHSIVQEHRDWVILAAKLTMTPADKDEVMALITQRRERRLATQPYDAFSAGSVFKNPSKNVHSWQLIDKVGMRGYMLNDAQVSLKHSNFIINLDRASAQDIYSLIKLVQDSVKEKENILLKREIELVNFDEEK
jgi:UDP-N-acetylmuramate dehydrogenase